MVKKKGVSKQELREDVLEDLNKIGNLSTLEKEIIDNLTNENKELNLTNAINYLYKNRGNGESGNNDNDGSIKLGRIENLTAISDIEGTKANLSWQNPTITEFEKVEIYVSTQDLTSANYDYCNKNTTKIVDSKVEFFEYTSTKNITYHFKAFAIYNVLGILKSSDGITTSVKVMDTKPTTTIKYLTASDGNEKISLSWTNPNDVDFDKVKIIRKEGSKPLNETDGIVIYEGKDSYYVDTNLTNNIDYYYRFFTYDDSNNVNDTDTQFVHAIPRENGYDQSISNFVATPDDGKVTLTWTNPIVASFKRVKIRRKIGNYPIGITDGDLVYDYIAQGTYPTEIDSYKDENLTNGVKYYYRAFTFNKDDQYCDITEGQQVTATPQIFKEYGVRWDKSADTVKRLGDAIDLVAVTGGKNDFNNLMPWLGMKRCNLSDSGVVNAYYGSPTYKVDGSNGQCMVEIPKFWYKIDYVSDKIVEFWICDGAKGGYKTHPAFFRDRKHLCDNDSGTAEEVDYRYYRTYLPSLNNDKLESKSGVKPKENISLTQARNYAKNRGNSWGLVDFNLQYAIQLLYLIEYAHFDSQTKIGKGFVDVYNSAPHITGGTDNLGNQSGNESNQGTDGKHQMTYRGIEDFWGNYYYWIDGFYCDSNYNILIGNKGFNDKGNGYKNYGKGVTSDIDGYIGDIQNKEECGFVISKANGSDTNKLYDYGRLADGLPVAGGRWDIRSETGAFYFYCHYAASNENWSVVASLAF
ncbi:fibronectin type III domain-containing protein [Clostridium botulinum]|uniref:hypothetical protein n=1 Tax=Clostridium botulinum TaxID=1491 RepID=UPI00220A22C3|nr:hypothetical protein [Clostridium botulinum]QDY27160.1 hypothetical protein CGQ40_20865 [Clostridium botulinum]